MNAIVCDIETSSMSPEKLAEFMPEFHEPKTKGSATAADKKQEWIDKCALKAHLGQVVAIGLKCDGEYSLHHGKPEKELLQAFWAYLARKPFTIVGHNLKGFDLPFLIRRSMINGVAQIKLMRGRYFADNVVDTMEEWGCGVYPKEMISLDHLSKALGVGKKTGDGAHFYLNYQLDQEAALNYLKNDLDLTEGCAKKMHLI